MLRYPVDEYLRHPRAVDEEGATEEMAHDLWAAVTIERNMFDRINRSPGWGVVGSVAWVILIGMNITL